MSSEEAYRNFINLCEENNVEAFKCVTDAIKCNRGKEKGILNLSTYSLPVNICSILGRFLSKDTFFREINLNDCMLTYDALNYVLRGLTGNVICKKLELKGNNINSQGTEALGNLLKQNTTIMSISLEWNSMGMLVNSFRLFCDALVSNKYIQMLDLRNNQITHDCAIELASALKMTKQLKYLDLRWNSIGIIGGRSILEMLGVNRNLIKLELSGNNIPNDILHSINSAIEHNCDRNNLHDSYSERQKILSNQLQECETNKKSEMSKLLNKLDKQEYSIKNLNSSHETRMKSLQDTLQDRKSQFLNLSTQFSLLQSELDLNRSENLELKARIERIELNSKEKTNQHVIEIKNVQEQKYITEAQLTKEILEKTEQNVLLQNKFDELDRKVKFQVDQIHEQKELITHMQANEKLKNSQYEERIAYEKQRFKESEHDCNERWQKELNVARKETHDQDSIYKERINKMEMSRIQLEEEINSLKSLLNSEKLNAEENLMTTKQHWKMEEELRLNQMNEKLRMVQNTRDELKSQCSQHISSISDLQNENASFNMENDTLKHRIEDLNSKLNDRNNTIMAEVNKVRLELNGKIDKLEAERKTKEELYDKIDQLQKEKESLQTDFKTNIGSKDIEILKLSEILKARDEEIKHKHNVDLQRTSMLQTAIMSYINQTPFVSPP